MSGPGPFDFRGARALVVGGGSGLGLSAAVALLDAGVERLVLASRTQAARSPEAASLLRRAAGRVEILSMDVSRPPALARVVRALGRRIGGLEIVVNAAGINLRAPAGEVTAADWDKVQATNARGAFLLSQAVHPLLRRAAREGNWARLVHVASIFGSVSYPHRANYAASKGALLGIVRTLALEWAAEGITVNAVSPGPFLTPINRKVLRDRKNYRAFCARIPLGRFGDPKEFAPAVLFLASRGASYVTGSDLRVDGGWTAA